MIESFAELCTDAAKQGTLIGFEMMPFCDIDSIEKAMQLVDGAGAKNGGICLDLWHIAKLKIPSPESREHALRIHHFNRNQRRHV